MKFIADLHIHSYFSRATSKTLNFEHLTKWAQLKGITVVGTGDIAHPGWLEEMKEKLEPAEEGLFRLKDDIAKPLQKEVHKACQGEVRFMLAGEISNIYKKNDKVRKIHNVVFLPSFAAVEKFQAELEKIGNIRSDGRPILGLSSRDLLEIVLQTDPQAYLIPAHIWTPWFALLGSKSGFDSVGECFDDLTPHIFALETGLSSDPPMNWRLSILDDYTLVSNSDAHSPQKLGREANIFDTDLSYPTIFNALKNKGSDSFLGTIEFFPEEGKYHFDGHRKCDINWDPETTQKHNGICPKCGRLVTVGVMHRIQELADRNYGQKPAKVHPFKSLIPLPEVVAEVFNMGVNTKRVQECYNLLLSKLGSELSILQDIPLEDIAQTGGTIFSEAIRRMREGQVKPVAGFDGEYGVIRLFDDKEREDFSNQLGLFVSKKKDRKKKEKLNSNKVSEKVDFDLWNQQQIQTTIPNINSDIRSINDHNESKPSEKIIKSRILSDLNEQQKEAVQNTDLPLIILAGPGTGKTHTLTYRIAFLIIERNISPENILAITFTNKAAEEMAQRLSRLLNEETSKRITIKTFHAFCAMILRSEGHQIGLQSNFSICSDSDAKKILKQANPKLKESEILKNLEKISTAKNKLLLPDSPEFEIVFKDDFEFQSYYQHYELRLQENNLLDYNDLISKTVTLFNKYSDVLKRYQKRYPWISVDEYQDINHAQYRLLQNLISEGSNLCVIGDPDQAIYGFRGANREYFLKFREDYPHAKTIYLNQNYRSSQNILNASGQVIANSQVRKNDKLWSTLVSDTKLNVYRAPTDKAEAEYVVHQIEQMVGGTSYFSIDSGRVAENDDEKTRSFSDFAVLYRLGAQSRLLEVAFKRSGIPFQITGKVSFYQKKEIKEILSFLWFLHDTNSLFFIEEILNPDLNDKKVNFTDTINQNGSMEISRDLILQKLDELNLNTSSKHRIRKTIDFLYELKNDAEEKPVSKLIESIHTFILGTNSRKVSEDTQQRIKQLILKAVSFENRLGDFLEYASLYNAVDDYNPKSDRVSLMTLHSSKGLEFPVVFIVGCEENLIPYLKDDKLSEPDEECRLFYVGMTRAQEKLILVNAKTRYLFGQRMTNVPSHYLYDIENTLKEFTEIPVTKKTIKKEKPKLQLELFL